MIYFMPKQEMSLKRVYDFGLLSVRKGQTLSLEREENQLS